MRVYSSVYSRSVSSIHAVVSSEPWKALISIVDRTCCREQLEKLMLHDRSEGSSRPHLRLVQSSGDPEHCCAHFYAHWEQQSARDLTKLRANTHFHMDTE